MSKAKENGSDRLVLLTGATGYVGGRLLRALEARGERVRCLSRRPDFLRPRVAEGTEVVEGDVLSLTSLQEALEGVDTAYYLVHSMGSRGDFRAKDRAAARKFALAARRCGVRRIIYLGGLGDSNELSEHLRSRQEVGRILGGTGVTTLEFRASIIIGSGSLSFEMIRSLVNKLPVMITPSWVRTLAQPIAIEDVIAFLLAALDGDMSESAIFEIGGADQVSYAEIMKEYARQRGLRRLMIPVPILSPRLSSLWLGLVTPLYARVGAKLIDSVRNSTVVKDDSAHRVFGVQPRGVVEAIERALAYEDRELAETRWSGALSSVGEVRSGAGQRLGARLVDTRSIEVAAAPAQAFAPIRRIGGEVGWYYADWLWRLRGLIDLMVGGAGTRRGRRDPEWLRPGETVDFWRVEAFEPSGLLRLYAEMKLPGRAWLQFEVEEHAGGSRIRQTAIFDPAGLFGIAYWYALYPIHKLVFAGMLSRIAAAAQVENNGSGSVGSVSLSVRRA